MYGDETNTVDNSMTFAKSIFYGKGLNFYELSVELAHNRYPANYSIMIYFLYAIWNIPMYFVTKILGNNSFLWNLWLLWGKTFIVVMTVLSAYLIYKILRQCCNVSKEKSMLASFIFLSSMTTFSVVFVIVQLDIIAIFFMLLGLYGYLKKDNVLFYISFIIAVPLKMFAIFLALPLILLRNKSIIKAGLKTVLMMSLLIIEKILYSGSIIYKYALGSQSRDAINQVLGSNIQIGSPISIFIALYICLLVYTYLYKSENVNNNIIIYVSFFVWAIFTAFVNINPYWIILVTPFLVINIFVNDKFLSTNVLLETIGSFSYFLYSSIAATLLADGQLITRLILPKIYNVADKSMLKYDSFCNMLHTLNYDRYTTLFSTIFVTTLLIILFLSRPSVKDKEEGSKQTKISEGLLLLRVGIIIGTIGVIFYSYTVKTNPIAYTNLELENEVSEFNLVDAQKDYVITQKIKFEDERQLKELSLKFHNVRYYRDNFILVNIEIWNVTKDMSIFYTSIAGTEIKDNSLLKINLNDAEVNKDDEYEIRLTGTKGTRFYQKTDSMYVYCTEEIDENIGEMEVNGEKKLTSLYFQIR